VPTNSSDTALHRLLGAVGECLDRESAETLVRLRADAEVQGRIEELADKCSDGSLSPVEREEYEVLVNVGLFISILQAKARLLLTSGRTD
jgi:hypothetical protein